jgi:hypothetical protein
MWSIKFEAGRDVFANFSDPVVWNRDAAIWRGDNKQYYKRWTNGSLLKSGDNEMYKNRICNRIFRRQVCNGRKEELEAISAGRISTSGISHPGCCEWPSPVMPEAMEGFSYGS